MVVMLDERREPDLEIARLEVAFQQAAVLQCLMPALDPTLRLDMEPRNANVAHVLVRIPPKIRHFRARVCFRKRAMQTDATPGAASGPVAACLLQGIPLL